MSCPAVEPHPDVVPSAVLDLIEGFRRSKTLFAAVKLGIFDGERPKGVAMDRLLDACVGLGLLERRGEEYANTPVADMYLRQTSPYSLAGYIRYSNALLYRLWANLEDAVMEGTNRWPQTFQKEASAFWREPTLGETKRDFLMGMHGLGMLSSPAVVGAFDLSCFTRFVDLGGATGHLALAAKERYPHMDVKLFELPEVIELAKKVVGDQVQLIGGDFFRDRLPSADIFALGRILHNQSKDASRWLLARVRAALPPGGAILLAEKLLEDEGRPSVYAHMQSLNMLVSADGRERTFAEYQALLEQAGFRQVNVRSTGAPLDAIFAIK